MQHIKEHIDAINSKRALRRFLMDVAEYCAKRAAAIDEETKNASAALEYDDELKEYASSGLGAMPDRSNPT